MKKVFFWLVVVFQALFSLVSCVVPSVFLCAFQVLLVLCFCFGVFGTFANVLKMLVLYFRICLPIWLVLLFCLGLEDSGEVGPFAFLVSFFVLSFNFCVFVCSGFSFGRFSVK